MAYEVGVILEGKVTGITKFGVFVSLPDGNSGMVHISEVASTFVREIRDFVEKDQQIKVKVVGIDKEGKIALSMKQVQEASAPAPRRAQKNSVPMNIDWKKSASPLSFEDKLNKFKQDSDERMSDLKRQADTKRGSFHKHSSNKGRGLD